MNVNAFSGLSYMHSKSPRQSPRHWVPQGFFRFYKNDNFGHIRAFVSVILDDWDKESTLEETLLTAGCFDYGPDNRIETRMIYSSARWHLKMLGPHDDGRLLSAESSNGPGEPLRFRRGSTFGVPLTSVNNDVELKSKIIDPLIQPMKRFQAI